MFKNVGIFVPKEMLKPLKPLHQNFVTACLNIYKYFAALPVLFRNSDQTLVVCVFERAASVA